MYTHFSQLQLGMRALFTGTLLVLGTAYLFAILHIYNSHAERDGLAGISIDDLVIAYHGTQEGSKLEAAIKGPMSGMLPLEEKTLIAAWVREGATQESYNRKVAPIISKRCVVCHDGSNPHIARLDRYSYLVEYTQLDSGTDIFTLIRVSHIHLFGMTFIFFIVGWIFSHARVQAEWFKVALIITPFGAILADIASWYLTKLYSPFAWIVVAAGALMGLCFAYMCFISLYQIWLSGFTSAPNNSTDS